MKPKHRWGVSQEQRFCQLAGKKAVGEATETDLIILERLKLWRRSARSIRSSEEMQAERELESLCKRIKDIQSGKGVVFYS